MRYQPSRRPGRFVVRLLVVAVLVSLLPHDVRPTHAQAPTPPTGAPTPPASALRTRLTKPAVPVLPPDRIAPLAPPTPISLPPFSVPAETPHPAIDLQVATLPDAVMVGQSVPFTVTVAVNGSVGADQLVVTLPPPPGAQPLPGAGLRDATQGWRWELGNVTAGSVLTLTGTVQVPSLPPGRALRLAPQVTARDVAPTTAVGGAIVIPRTADATAAFRAGSATTLQSADERVRVQFAPQGFDRPLQLRHRTLTAAAADLRARKRPLPGALPNARRGLGAFVLDATDTNGADVHQFSQPLTITLSYTPEQLEVLHIPEGALTLFWFDETQRRWVAQATDVDATTHTASALVDHFSDYQFGPDVSPSEAYIPSVKNWQVSLLTGAASFSYPLDLPAGSGGLRPTLNLSYNSTETDSNAYDLDLKQSSWVGKGWSLGVPYIARNRQAGDNIDTFSLVINGTSSELVRGKQLPGFNNSLNYLTGWDWRAVDENFVRVRYDPDPDGNQGGWVVWTTDGTRYEFRDSAEQSYAGDEDYKWMVSRVEDPHGNYMRYSYDKLVTAPCNDNPDIWPTQIRWGGNARTNAPLRYQVVFTSLARQAQNAWDTHLDMAWDYSDSICGGNKLNSPHETRRLQVVEVQANQSQPYQDTPASWERVRQYRFTTDYSLLADSGNATYQKLTLKQLDIVGKDDTLPPPPPLTFRYRTANPGQARLETADNGQGGTVTFAYTSLPDVYTVITTTALFNNNEYDPNHYANRWRVSQKTLGDGRNNTYVTTYTYGPFAVNAANRTKINPRPASNSAVFERADNQNSTDKLAVRPHREFRGHESVIEKTYNTTNTSAAPIQWVEHFFRLGDVLDVAGCGANVTYSETNICYTTQREREMQKGREWQTLWKSGTNALLKSVKHTFALGTIADIVQAPPNTTNTIDWSAQVNRGLWRAFVYESQTEENLYEGQSTPVTHRTTYAYDPAAQGNVPAGNLTRMEDRLADGNKLRVTERQFLRRADADVQCTAVGNDTCGSTTLVGGYLVDRMSQEAIYDGSSAGVSGNLIALSQQFYDQTSTPASVPTRGELQRTTRYVDVQTVLAPSTAGRTLNGVDVVYGYDSAGYGNRTQVTTYAGLSTRSTTSAGVVTWGAPQGVAATTTTEYDPRFNVYSTRTIQPPNASGVQLDERADYDYRMGTLTRATDANGTNTTAEYDPLGRIVKLIRPGDTSASPTATLLYADHDRPVRYEVQMKRSSSTYGDPYAETYMYYDGLGRKIQTKQESTGGSAQHIVTDMRYDALGQVVAQSQPRYVDNEPVWYAYTDPGAGALYRPTTTTFDTLGRVLTMTDPNNATTQTAYYQVAGGTAMSVIDANDHKVRREYDVLGRLLAVREYPTGASQTASTNSYYTYSRLDLLTQVNDAASNSNVTQIGYDSIGRKTSMTDPDMGSWLYSYDGRGNLLTQRDARTITTSFQYDLLNRLTQKSFANSDATVADPTVTYGYDQSATYPNGKGQRTSMCVSNGGTGCAIYGGYSYDVYGHVARQEQSAGGITRAIVSTYGTDGLLTALAYPNGQTLLYDYDAAGRQKAACFTTGDCVANITSYTALNQPQQYTTGDIVTSSWSYNNQLARLDRLQIGSFFDRAYGYDNVGNVKTITDNQNSANSQSFTYDARDRLTGWTLNGTTQSYAYDSVGNLTSKAGVGYSYGTQATTCAQGALSKKAHAVTKVGTNGYCYDQNGNLTSGGGRTLSWNAENMPKQITQTGVSESYAYDGDSARVLRTSNGVTTYYLAGLWEEDTGGAQRVYYPFNGRTVMVLDAGGYLYMHGDHLGSVSATTRVDGLVVQQQEFDPWGAVRSGGVPGTTRNFTGQLRDDTGLLFYNARYYDPGLARFLSADTDVPDATNPQDFNRYSYVKNNPVRYTDPTGHSRYDGGGGDGGSYGGSGYAYVGSGGGSYGGSGGGSTVAAGAAGAATGIGIAYMASSASSEPSDPVSGDTSGQTYEPSGTSTSPTTYPDEGERAAAPPVSSENQATDAPSQARGGTYVLKDPQTGEVVRSGRTNNLARREREHARDPRLKQYDYDVDARTDDYYSQRGREQHLHEKYKPRENKVSGVDSRNPNAGKYKSAGDKTVGKY